MVTLHATGVKPADSQDEWSNFVSGLDEDTPWCYVHRVSKCAYFREGGPIGRGQYGNVYKFVAEDLHSAEVAGLPSRFAIKSLDKDCAETEIAAVHMLKKMRLPVVAHAGLVRADEVRRRDSVSPPRVCMPLYEGDVGSLHIGPCVRNAIRMCECSAAVIESLWASGIAYCDLKMQNILYRRDGRKGVVVVLGDLGGVVGVHAGMATATGLFTYPPQRSVDLESDETSDGLVDYPTEQDLVWSLGVLLMAISIGQSFVIRYFSAKGLRTLVVETGGLDNAFDMSIAAATHHAQKLRRDWGARGARVSNAVAVAVAAWEGDPHATLSAFRTELDHAR